MPGDGDHSRSNTSDTGRCRVASSRWQSMHQPIESVSAFTVCDISQTLPWQLSQAMPAAVWAP